MKLKKDKTYITYTILFCVISFLVFGVFIIYNKSFVWNSDGLNAYKKNGDQYNLNEYVRFNEEGIKGKKSGDKTTFSLTVRIRSVVPVIDGNTTETVEELFPSIMVSIINYKPTLDVELRATDSTTCVSCIAGTYNEDAGKALCTKCPAGTYNSNIGSKSSIDCLICPSGTSSSEGSSLSSSRETACQMDQRSVLFRSLQEVIGRCHLMLILQFGLQKRKICETIS